MSVFDVACGAEADDVLCVSDGGVLAEGKLCADSGVDVVGDD